MQKKKRETAEDFVGWKSDDGLLEVVDIYGTITYKVICHKCKEDKELFPDGYFVSTKGSLKGKCKPCGCSKRPSWNKDQYLVLARRAAKGRFIVHGFAEEFHGQKTKLGLECLKDGHEWVAGTHHIVNKGSGCPRCAGQSKPTEQEALDKCKELCKDLNYKSLGFPNRYKNKNSRFEYLCSIHGKQDVSYDGFINKHSKCPACSNRCRLTEQTALIKCQEICETEGYEPVGFPYGYKNALKSIFKYKCPTHGFQNVIYSSFVNMGTRCRGCWKERQKELSNRNGYYPERKDEQDFLYVLDFDGEFIKIGRSFDVERRIGKNELQKDSGISNILKLRIFTATHKEIYDLEQELHSELRERNFQHQVDWSTECFTSDSLPFLNMLLDKCGLEEVKL